MTIAELKEYVRNRYGVEPEYLWADFPDAFVFRHTANRRWFAVTMEVRRERLGLPGRGTVFITDVKCGPLLSGSYLGTPGVVPAWHMNKTHWLGVLPEEASDDTVRELLELSYDLTKKTDRKKERPL